MHNISLFSFGFLCIYIYIYKYVHPPYHPPIKKTFMTCLFKIHKRFHDHEGDTSSLSQMEVKQQNAGFYQSEWGTLQHYVT